MTTSTAAPPAGDSLDEIAVRKTLPLRRPGRWIATVVVLLVLAQLEAAHALGLPKGRQLRRIVLPQASRAIVPAYGLSNEAVPTSLVNPPGLPLTNS